MAKEKFTKASCEQVFTYLNKEKEICHIEKTADLLRMLKYVYDNGEFETIEQLKVFFHKEGEEGLRRKFFSIQKENGKKMLFMVDVVFRQYESFRNEITPGIISGKHVEFLMDKLSLKVLTWDELSCMWFAVEEFFNDKILIDGNFRPLSAEDMGFFLDSQSAWSETINSEFRRRKKECPQSDDDFWDEE